MSYYIYKCYELVFWKHSKKRSIPMYSLNDDEITKKLCILIYKEDLN